MGSRIDAATYVASLNDFAAADLARTWVDGFPQPPAARGPGSRLADGSVRSI